MKRLVLLRHAKSDHPVGVTDHERPLGPRGLRDAPRVGADFVRRGLTFDRAVVSTATRTRETFALLGLDVAPVFEQRIYEASPADLLAIVRGLPDSAATVLMVGHNPGFEMLAAFLAREGDRHRLAEPGEKFPTAAYADLSAGIGRWSEAGQGAFSVEAFVRPGSLQA